MNNFTYRAPGRWTPEQDALLTELVEKGGVSFGVMELNYAKEFGGRSRNALIGRAHRLNLSGDVRPRKRKARNKAPKPPLAGERRSNATPKAAPIPQEPIAAPESLPVPLTLVHSSKQPRGVPDAVLACDDHHCRFPIGDPDQPDFHFCMKPLGDERTYCAEHRKVLRHPPAEKTEAQRLQWAKRNSHLPAAKRIISRAAAI